MDKQYIEENVIDTKYLRNQLTPEETEEFEVYLMENPEMVERLELDSVFVSDMPQVPSAKIDNPRFKEILAKSWATPLLGGLGLFFAGVFTTGLLLTYTDRQPNSTQIVYLSQVRSAGEITEYAPASISLSGTKSLSQDRLVLVLDTGILSEIDYWLSISKTEGDARTHSQFEIAQKSNHLGEIIISIKSRQLDLGLYVIQVSNKGKSNAAEFFFEVTH